MIKKTYLSIILLSLFAILYSCDSETGKDPIVEEQKIEIAREEDKAQTITSETNKVTVSFEATSRWKVYVEDGSNKSWVKIEQKEGEAGKNTLHIKTDNNETYEERSAQIVLVCGKDKKTITITQKQKNALLISSNKIDVQNTEGEISIEVKSNVSVKYEIKAEWIKPIKTKVTRGLVSTTYKFNVDANESSETRTGEIFFYNEDDKKISETAIIKQQGKDLYITLNENKYVVDQSATTLRIPFENNGDWTASISESQENSWIQLENNKGKGGKNVIAAVITENKTYDERNAEIVLSCGNIQKRISVTQKQKNALIITSNKINVPNTQQEVRVEVKANVKVKYEIKSNWIKDSNNDKTRALSSTIFNFIVDANPSEEERIGEVVFYNEEDRSITETLRITQNSTARQITIEKTDYSVSSAENTLNIQFEVNGNWNATISDTQANSWIELVKAQGEAGNNTLSVKIKNNDTYKERKANIILTSGREQKTITITQKQKNALLISSNTIEADKRGQTISIEVQANIRVRYEIKGNWITGTNNTTRNLVSNTYQFNIDENNGYEDRTGQIVFYSEDDNSLRETVTIEQKHKGVAIIAETREYRTIYQRGNVEIKLRSNVELDVSSDVSWARYVSTRALTDKTVTIELEENNTSSERKAIITLKDRNSDAKEEISIFQAGNPTTNASKDKEVKVLQQHTKGNGIKLVLMGDGYIEEDLVEGGEYDKMMKKAMEAFFDVEPLTSLREYFDVISIKALSQTREINKWKTAFNAYYNGRIINGNKNKCKEYAKIAIGSEDLSNVTTIIIVNDRSWAGTCYMYHEDASSIAMCANVHGGGVIFRRMVQHEGAGHGFGLLADEYGGKDRPSDIAITNIRNWADKHHRYLNIDLNNDPEKVRWNIFLKDERYRGEHLGVYEGGHEYNFGVYRPAQTSIMKSLNIVGFNPPSRLAIYKRAMRLAYGDSWQYNHDEFIKFDEKGRKENAYTPTRTYVEDHSHHMEGCCVIEH